MRVNKPFCRDTDKKCCNHICMDTFGQRLRSALHERNVSQSQLARMLGVQPQAVQYLCSDKAQRSRYTSEIASVLGISADWLATGRGTMTRGKHASATIIAETAPAYASRAIPVINYVQAGNPRAVVDAYAQGDGFRTISLEGPIAHQVGPYAFALEISGDSMADEFRSGDTVVVDPDAPIKPGAIVVAKLDRDDAATIKKYRDRGRDAALHPVFELAPLNPDYAAVTIDADNPGTIIGPVVEHRRLLNR